MHYFIDGYNFLFHLYEEVDPLKEKRAEIILHLQEKLAALDLNMTIVFDNYRSSESPFPTRFDEASLEIIYTPACQSADNYILEALTWKKHNHNETVVTSDKFLEKQVKTLGAKILSIEAFVKWIVKKESFLFKKESKLEQESTREFERLLEIFEKKLKEEDFY